MYRGAWVSCGLKEKVSGSFLLFRYTVSSYKREKYKIWPDKTFVVAWLVSDCHVHIPCLDGYGIHRTGSAMLRSIRRPTRPACRGLFWLLVSSASVLSISFFLTCRLSCYILNQSWIKATDRVCDDVSNRLTLFRQSFGGSSCSHCSWQPCFSSRWELAATRLRWNSYFKMPESEVERQDMHESASFVLISRNGLSWCQWCGHIGCEDELCVRSSFRFMC